MILNESIVIKGNLVVLVPYEEYHVLKYHEWMKSEELQLLTASEPLSLDEEYEMQKSWRSDPDKCTFIVLDREKYNECGDEVEAMVGDTNIFLLKTDDRESVAEIEIMIAENSARGKGFGKEALLFMLRYGVEDLHINEYEAKIGVDNSKSISLFTKIGFQKISENKVFNEVTFHRLVTDSWKDWLLSETKFYSKENRYWFELEYGKSSLFAGYMFHKYAANPETVNTEWYFVRDYRGYFPK